MVRGEELQIHHNTIKTSISHTVVDHSVKSEVWTVAGWALGRDAYTLRVVREVAFLVPVERYQMCYTP